MESDAPFPYGPIAARPVHPGDYLHGHLNPPASKRVLDHLTQSLTLPACSVRKGQARAKERLDREILWAYNACAEVIRRHSRSFYLSARFLPHAKRQGIIALYAFCRTSDDLVDAAGALPDHKSKDNRDGARAALDRWAALVRDTAIEEGLTGQGHPVAAAWADTRGRFGIPSHLADELLSGIRMDLTIDRYETWDDLWLYCYRVASTVGLMSMYITGANSMEAIPYAVQLGVALQLTNILRDIGEDARAGRVYLPVEEMARFGYTEEMLFEGIVNHDFTRLLEFQIERAHALYRSAMPGIAMLPRDSRLAITAAATLYRGILDQIRSSRYDVFTHRAHLSMREKLCALPRIWLASRRYEMKGE